MPKLEDDKRRELYWSLLRGIAKTAQDQLCAADRQHDWGDWRRYQVRHDDGDLPLKFEPELVRDRAFHVRAERRCLNCGKEQFDPPAPSRDQAGVVNG